MRFRILILSSVAAAATFAGCSASGLDPAPSIDAQSAGAKKDSDTTVATGPQTPPQLPPVVSSFALSGTVKGMEPGTDTTRQDAVPNAGVKLVKTMTLQGDTLTPSVTVASTTTDAQGKYRFENLAPAYYRIEFSAPAGSPFEDGAWAIGPARQAEIVVNVALVRKP
jgi:hypothetical protein